MSTLFFGLSKIIWGLFAPDSLIVVGIVMVAVLLWRKKYRWAKRLLCVLGIGLGGVGLFPVHEWLYYPLDTRFPTNPELPKQMDGIIVLGGATVPMRSQYWNQVEVGQAAERPLVSIALAKRFPEAKLVFTGGSALLFDQDLKEAHVIERLYGDYDVDMSRVLLEPKSRNTYENAVYTKELVKPAEGSNWLLITSAWHMPRSMGVFQKAGWDVIPYPVDHESCPGHLLRMEWALAEHLFGMKVALKEWVGLFVYRLTGKTSALLPGPTG